MLYFTVAVIYMKHYISNIIKGRSYIIHKPYSYMSHHLYQE